MATELHWGIWLLSGMAVGLVAGIGKSGLSGIVLALGILGSPVLILMTSGTAPLPFVAFYGGLVAVSSFLFRCRNAARDAVARGAAFIVKSMVGLIGLG